MVSSPKKGVAKLAKPKQKVKSVPKARVKPALPKTGPKKSPTAKSVKSKPKSKVVTKKVVVVPKSSSASSLKKTIKSSGKPLAKPTVKAADKSQKANVTKTPVKASKLVQKQIILPVKSKQILPKKLEPAVPSKLHSKNITRKPETSPMTAKVKKIHINVPGSVIVSPDYVPRDREEFMNPVMLEYFRLKLLKWKIELLREAENTVHDTLQGTELQKPDLVDRASEETDHALELRTRDRERKLISKIDEALLRIGDGSYGYCEETGEPISVGRLDARPIATLSIEAQERHERKERTQRDD